MNPGVLVLRELREKSRLTQQQVATQLGFDKSYISQIENEHVPIPKKRVLIQLLQVYQVQPKYFEQRIKEKNVELEKHQNIGQLDEEGYWEHKRYLRSLGSDGLPPSKFKISNKKLRVSLATKYGTEVLNDIHNLIISFIICFGIYSRSYSRKSSVPTKDSQGRLVRYPTMSSLQKREYKNHLWYKKNENSREVTIFFVYFIANLLKKKGKKQWRDVQIVLCYCRQSIKLRGLIKEIDKHQF